MTPSYDRRGACPLDPRDQGPEFELLLTCCRPVAKHCDVERQIALAKQALDTKKVIELARRHKVSALVYCNLKQHQAATFDAALIDELARRYKNNAQKAMRSLQTLHQMAQLKPAFPVFVMKGLDVALRAYHDLAARDVGDIDLLVEPENLRAAYQMLATHGWTSNTSSFEKFFTSKILRNISYDIGLYRAGFPKLELHWRPTYNPYEFSMAHLNSSSISRLANTGLAGFNAEDLLIYLCVHGSKHGWGRLKWLYDLPNVIEQIELDWPLIWQRADQVGASFALQQALLLAEQYCGVALSAPMRAGFRYRISPKQWQAIRQFQSGPESWMESPPFHLLLRLYANRISTAIKPKILLWYCLWMFNPNIRDFELIPLPHKWEPVYFLLRPFTWSIRRLQIWKARRSAVG
ncbi:MULTISPECIES: nucleotidyltransferase family protein [unclassified Undibacterium]|uniref:nucleotidyltransferase domain-containing protein n=1 Tax=unclassified Undibacterium TaxID=2630295 RepID=UPI002AC975C7|nr:MULTISPECIES: nucleotidyltransferase family protein [unclassified Undibacterium]MEB0141191.1 nucleotidyltransferase family protein [Undibacterium sp. CCC2.1]MEB0174245.1 nucleotidyltransferase family protein [Undibacterium sp. CCC1.1]MEB0178192.1 nucleotidyltransferase family protein [Undibacterium sp. CCC3.4]MEB0217398.1 nucleotidyltransferase family protein [Undibacterium sp. 5I2]WPX42134.1 nucleotidyltransferase family protein [Undibacterium sp. CCC3.4]